MSEIAEHGESEAARVSAYALLAKYLGISDKIDHRVQNARNDALAARMARFSIEDLRKLAGPDEPWPVVDVQSRAASEHHGERLPRSLREGVPRGGVPRGGKRLEGVG